MWGVITGVLGIIWDGVQAGLDAIVVALQWAAGALKAGLLGAWSAVRFAWSDILKPVGQFLGDAFSQLKSFYTSVIKPALGWLGRVTSALKSVYNSLLKPILSTLDHARQILQLLELLHVPLAAKLDTELGDLERKLSLPLQLVIGVLNGLTNRVESYVLTIDNLFTKVTHLASIGRDIHDIENIRWSAWSGGLTSAQRAAPGAPNTLAPVDDHVTFLQSTLTDDAVGDGIDIAGAVALLGNLVSASA